MEDITQKLKKMMKSRKNQKIIHKQSKVMEGKYRDYVKDPFNEEKELTVAEVVTDLKVNLANIKRNLYWLKRAHHKLLVIKEYAEVS